MYYSVIFPVTVRNRLHGEGFSARDANKDENVDDSPFSGRSNRAKNMRAASQLRVCGSMYCFALRENPNDSRSSL